MNEIIFECMGNVSLTGVTGKFEFLAGADPTSNVKLEQIRGEWQLAPYSPNIKTSDSNSNVGLKYCLCER